MELAEQLAIHFVLREFVGAVFVEIKLLQNHAGLRPDRCKIEFLVEGGYGQETRRLRKVLRQERRVPLDRAHFRRRIALLNAGLIHSCDLGRRHRAGSARERGVLAKVRQAVVGNFLAAQNEGRRHIP